MSQKVFALIDMIALIKVSLKRVFAKFTEMSTQVKTLSIDVIGQHFL